MDLEATVLVRDICSKQLYPHGTGQRNQTKQDRKTFGMHLLSLVFFASTSSLPPRLGWFLPLRGQQWGQHAVPNSKEALRDLRKPVTILSID